MITRVVTICAEKYKMTGSETVLENVFNTLLLFMSIIFSSSMLFSAYCDNPSDYRPLVE